MVRGFSGNVLLLSGERGVDVNNDIEAHFKEKYRQNLQLCYFQACLSMSST